MRRIRMILQCVGVAVLLLVAPGRALRRAALRRHLTKAERNGPDQGAAEGRLRHLFPSRHHARTGEKDVADADLNDCARQRNLSDAGLSPDQGDRRGVQDAADPGGRGVLQPVLPVPRHRAQHLREGRPRTRPCTSPSSCEAERATITTQLLDLLATVPPQASTRPRLAHREPAGSRRIWPKPEGVAHIFKPSGDGTFTYVGVMQPETWLGRGEAVPRCRTRFPGLVRPATGSLDDAPVRALDAAALSRDARGRGVRRRPPERPGRTAEAVRARRRPPRRSPAPKPRGAPWRGSGKLRPTSSATT